PIDRLQLCDYTFADFVIGESIQEPRHSLTHFDDRPEVSFTHAWVWIIDEGSCALHICVGIDAGNEHTSGNSHNPRKELSILHINAGLESQLVLLKQFAPEYIWPHI